MDELPGQAVAEGWWCTACEVFEAEDDQDQWHDDCPACGCNGAAHRRVEVVVK